MVRLAALDLHDLVPRLVGAEAEAKVRTLGLPRKVAASLVAEEHGIRGEDSRLDELRHQIHAEASARVLLWDTAGQRNLAPDAYREARQRLHGRDLLDFRPAASGEPVVLMDGVEMSLREAVVEARAPRKVQIAVPAMPEGYRRIKRIDGFAFGTDAAADVRERLLGQAPQAASVPQETSEPDQGPDTPDKSTPTVKRKL